MDQNKIDRLFREKMDNLEVMPSSTAWSQAEKQIRPKRAYKAYWLAASVILIFASWLLWPSQVEQNLTPIASEINYPPILNSSEFDFEEIKVAEVKKEKRKKVMPNATTQLVAKVEKPKTETLPVFEEITPLEIDTKSTVAVAEVESPEAIENVKSNVVDFSAVKITYIASTENNSTEQLQKTDSANTFKKIIAFAEKIDPAEIMADFKSAKDNLLNNGFKKKEKNSL